jgi:hypothetical protein
MSDIARIRFQNTSFLLEEFARSRNGLDELRGIETQFALHLGISKNYWSALKTGKRQIGSILARQFEARVGKPVNWLDQERQNPTRLLPQGDDEWLVVGLLLSAYRAAPGTVRAGLLELVDRAMRERTRATPADNERKKN